MPGLRPPWVARQLSACVLVGLFLAGCAGTPHDEPVPAPSSPVGTAAGTGSPTAPSGAPDFGHVKATSPEEVLDAVSEAGLTCSWTTAPPDPSTDESVHECAKWNTYLWFSPTAPGSGFVDYVRKDTPKNFKGLAYMTGDHWVMVGEREVILEMSRSIGGDAGTF